MGNPVVEQEKEKGHDVFPVTEKIFAEVSEFRGKMYIGIREWFKADDGTWYRTKKGINFTLEDYEDFVAQIEDITEFVMTRIPDTFKTRKKKTNEEGEVPY